jgi:hypothetical protein
MQCISLPASNSARVLCRFDVVPAMLLAVAANAFTVSSLVTFAPVISQNIALRSFRCRGQSLNQCTTTISRFSATKPVSPPARNPVPAAKSARFNKIFDLFSMPPKKGGKKGGGKKTGKGKPSWMSDELYALSQDLTALAVSPCSTWAQQ